MCENKDYGVIYLAFGYEYFVMAMLSIKSLKNVSKDIPVCLVTNLDKDPSIYSSWNNEKDKVIRVEDLSANNRFYKTNIYDISPFYKSLFLDCDTIVLEDITPSFKLLEYFDCAASLIPEPAKGKQAKLNPALLSGDQNYIDLPHWNTGVILFKKNKNSKELFNNWCKIFQNMEFDFDQPSFLESVFVSNTKFLSLDNRWNRRVNQWKYYGEKISDTIVLHYMFSIDNNLKVDLLEVDKKFSDNDNKMVEFINSKRVVRYKKFSSRQSFFQNIDLIRDHIKDTFMMKYIIKNYLRKIIEK